MATVVTSVAGAVLAGGASSRMGRPKAFIEIDGRTLLDRAVGALTAAAIDPVIVVGGDQAAIEAAGHRFVPDEYPGEGPLGGIISALGAVDTDLVVVLACDLLAASPDAVTRLTDFVATPVQAARICLPSLFVHVRNSFSCGSRSDAYVPAAQAINTAPTASL